MLFFFCWKLARVEGQEPTVQFEQTASVVQVEKKETFSQKLETYQLYLNVLQSYLENPFGKTISELNESYVLHCSLGYVKQIVITKKNMDQIATKITSKNEFLVTLMRLRWKIVTDLFQRF